MCQVHQVLWSAFMSGPTSLTPSIVAAAAAALWFRQQPSQQQLRQAIRQLPGLCATAMFALAPIPQLVRALRPCDGVVIYCVQPMYVQCLAFIGFDVAGTDVSVRLAGRSINLVAYHTASTKCTSMYSASFASKQRLLGSRQRCRADIL